MKSNPSQYRDTRKRYHEDLQHSEWISLRDRLIRERACCESCGSNDRPYEVHHRGYLPGRRAWEYEDEHLSVLCNNCHFEITEDADKIWNMILKLDPIHSRLAVKLVEAIISDQNEETLMRAYRSAVYK